MMVFIRVLGIVLVYLSVCGRAWSAPIKVEILTDDDYPPYSYVLNGEAKGIYIDLVRKAAKYLAPEYDVQVVAMPWKRALKKLEMGQSFAVLPPYLHTELRPYIYPYSIPLATEHVVTFCRSGIQLSKAFESAMQLPNPITIGQNSGYLILNDKYHDAVKKNNLLILENKSTEANITKLLKGRIDCYVNDELSTEYSLALLKNGTANLPDIKIDKVDVLSSQTAHIGYTRINENNFPYKKDFVTKMDKALQRAIEKNTKNNAE